MHCNKNKIVTSVPKYRKANVKLIIKIRNQNYYIFEFMISYTNVIIFKTIAVYQKPVEKILELLPLIEPLELDLHLACLSHNACSLISQSLIVPLLLLYTNRLHSCGWNSAAVITSVSSSMLAGFMSTISHPIKKSPCTRSIKKNYYDSKYIAFSS